MSTYRFMYCSNGSSMFSPTEVTPASRAPRFAASITPGPPPVTIAKPASPSMRAVRRASSYGGSGSLTRAEPKIETAGPIPPSTSKPWASSRSMRASLASSERVVATAGDSALRISSSGVAGVRGSVVIAGASGGARDRRGLRFRRGRAPEGVVSERRAHGGTARDKLDQRRLGGCRIRLEVAARHDRRHLAGREPTREALEHLSGVVGGVRAVQGGIEVGDQHVVGLDRLPAACLQPRAVALEQERGRRVADGAVRGRGLPLQLGRCARGGPGLRAV